MLERAPHPVRFVEQREIGIGIDRPPSGDVRAHRIGEVSLAPREPRRERVGNLPSHYAEMHRRRPIEGRVEGQRLGAEFNRRSLVGRRCIRADLLPGRLPDEREPGLPERQGKRGYEAGGRLPGARLIQPVIAGDRIDAERHVLRRACEQADMVERAR